MVLSDLTAYLETQGIGTRSVNLFYGILPDTPDACVTLFEYGGAANEPDTGGTTNRVEFPRVQALCRGVKDDYDGPRQKIQDVVVAFTRIANQVLYGVHYKAVAALQPPGKLRQDNNFRFEFTCNFEVTKGFSAT